MEKKSPPTLDGWYDKIIIGKNADGYSQSDQDSYL